MPPRSDRRRYLARQLLPVLAALFVVVMFYVIVPRILDTRGPILNPIADGELTSAQTQTLDMVVELNGFLISLTTLMFGGLGWYISQYRPTRSLIVRAVFFATVGFLALAFWYAAQTYGAMTSELATNFLGLRPGYSQILHYVELEFAACATAAVLILIVFADAVTRGKPLDATGSQ